MCQKKKKWAFLILSICTGAFVLSPVFAANIYVSPSGGGDGSIGTPTALQTGLDIARINGEDDTIFLQQGTYDASTSGASTFEYGTSSNDNMAVLLQGGWNTGFTSQSDDPALTMLDGGGDAPVLYILADASGVSFDFELDTIAIQNGLSTTHGAGIRVYTGVSGTSGTINLTIHNSLVQNNHTSSSNYGGGLYSRAYFEIYDTTFSSNSAHYGGALFVGDIPGGDQSLSPLVENCTFDSNASVLAQGGAIANYVALRVKDSTFTNTRGPGSTLHNNTGSSLDISNSIFAGNKIDYWGSAIQFWDAGGIVTNCLFYDNEAGYTTNNGYGAISAYNPTAPAESISILNSSFVGNQAAWSGAGAIHNRGMTFTIYNSVFWDNEGTSGLTNQSGAASISNSDIHNLVYNGFTDSGNNINSDPLFVNTAGPSSTWDLHLQTTPVLSPAIDTGDNLAPGLPAVDIENKTRIYDGDTDGTPTVDMGAYEYIPYYTIGGSVTGLAPGNNVVLQNNAGDDLTVNADGSFTFATELFDTSAYAVTVLTQPTTPNQTCTITSGSGTLDGTDVTSVDVTCVTNTYSVGGSVAGLAAGNSVVLQNNSGDDLTVNTDGSFTFATALGDESSYDITVLTQPTTPNQTCTVTDGSGTLAGADVISVNVTCVTNTYSVGGSIAGLAAGNSVVMQNNGGDDLTVSADGSFTFVTALDDGSSYDVTVLTQPDSPNQTCTVTNGSGTLAGADVTNVNVICVNTYSVGGSVAGLALGNSVILQNNGGDDLAVDVNGNFTFATPLDDGSSYDVTVLTQPTTPNQTCTVTNGSGTLAGADVTNVNITCVNTYSVGGSTAGLAAGNTVVLQNNGGDDLAVNVDGNFTFTSGLADGNAYAVTVLTQPDSPNQTCTVSNGTGTISGADVTNINVTCVTNTYSVGGSVTGLIAGNSVVLQNNGGDDLTVNTDGSFTFASTLTDGNDYAVTVLTQPDSPNQTCTISNSTGTLSGVEVTDVTVICGSKFPWSMFLPAIIGTVQEQD